MKLGFVGIGLMGKPMTLRLLAAGHEVAVWNRSPEKLEPVLAKGAQRADSPAGVARFADVVMMCVTDQKAAEAVLFQKVGAEVQNPGVGVPGNADQLAAHRVVLDDAIKVLRTLPANGAGEIDGMDGENAGPDDVDCHGIDIGRLGGK